MLHELCILAEKAGAQAMRFYENCASVTRKGDSSPLTDADRASHDFLMESLPGLIPGIPIISEESQEPVTIASAAADRFWLVDPLDGTKEFLKRTGEFTVNIALIEQGRAVMGVVQAPAVGLIYFADAKDGAFRRRRREEPSPIRVQAANPERPKIVASKDHAGPLVQALLSRMPNAELKSMGSSLKFCLVAEGQADIYLRDVPTMEWDTAAAQCIVEAAGGTVCTLDGHPLQYGKAGLKNPTIVTFGDRNLQSWRSLTL